MLHINNGVLAKVDPGNAASATPSFAISDGLELHGALTPHLPRLIMVNIMTVTISPNMHRSLLEGVDVSTRDGLLRDDLVRPLVELRDGERRAVEAAVSERGSEAGTG